MGETDVTGAEDLYGLPLEEFTPARDRLAKNLKDRGETEEARRVKALRKPSLPAWAVNQLARTESEDLRRLFEVRADLGTSSADDLRRLTAERRTILAGLLSRAEELLAAAGHSASATTRDAIAKTLQAGGSEDERRRIEQGTLDRPLTPTGFEGLGGFEPSADASPDSPGRARPSAAARRAAERLDEEARTAEADARELTTAAEAAAREAQDLARRAEQARRRAERARRKADAALDDLA